MISREKERRPVLAAAITAGLLLGVSGLIYRVVAAPVSHVPLDPNALRSFPLQIGEWTGKDVPIDPDLRKAIDADSYISREYCRRNGSQLISLYFPCGTNASELLQHVPENCYVGAGWTLVSRRSSELLLSGGQKLPCSIVQFTRGGLDVHRLVLLHFLVVDGEYFTTFSTAAQAKGWRHFATIGFAAQVQIVASAGSTSLDQAAETVMDFALDAGPAMERFFEELKRTRISEKSTGN